MGMQTARQQSSAPPFASSAAHYQIRRRLGEGGFAEVFEAWDIRLRRAVALKRLKPAQARLRPDTLLTEGQLVASLNHAAFVQVYAIDDDGESQSIVMELVRGTTLRDYAGGLPQTEALTLDIVRQVAEAMDEAHRSLLAHGDLKASNLMIEPTGRVRILDFGLARRFDPLATQSGALDNGQGTIAYMAPERLQGHGPTPAADIYALGVVMYELLAGKLPFSDLNGFALAAAHLQSTPARWPLPPTVRPAVAALLHAMIERDPARRCASMRQVCDTIAGILDAAADATPAPATAPRRARRGWTGWAWLGAAAVVLSVAVAGDGHLPAVQDHAALSDVAAMDAGIHALRRFEHDGSLERAISLFDDIVARNPRHAGATAALSLAYSLRYVLDSRDESWLRRADASAQQALMLDDQLALAHAAQAWVRELQGKWDEALRLDERSLALDPQNLFALNSKAHILIETRRFDDAEAVIKAALALYPDERWFTDLLGTLRFRQGDAVGAERAFRRSIALDPGSAVSYANLNGALLYQHRDDEALHVLQQGLQVRPDSRLYGNLGAALFARGDIAGAARAFEQAISTDKGNPNFYLDWANLADALRWLPGREAESRQAYRHAIDLLQPLLERDPDNRLLQSRLAMYAAKTGAQALARQAIDAALAGTATGADIHFRAAIVYELLGDRQRALAEVALSKSLGYPVNLIESEPDLLSLRRDLRYHQ
jgi:serine/threonine-protein kinase